MSATFKYTFIQRSVIFLLGVFCFIPSALFAQKTIIHGLVLDSVTYAPVTNAQVTNTNTNKTSVTNKKGMFTVSVSPGNVLFFTATNYHFDTLHYSILRTDTIIVYLAPVAHILPGVTVTARAYNIYQMDSMKRRTEFLSDVGNPKRSTFSTANSNSGIALNLDFFIKHEKNKRRAYKLYEEREKDSYINSRFSKEIVESYTGFHGDTLQRFMQLYAPSYEWLRSHPTDENIFYYINDKMKSFYHRKENH